MKNGQANTTEKAVILKAARLLLLKIHKSLIDTKRAEFEQQNGAVTSGQFLNLLLEDQDFQWLRKFSVLVVEIDEMLDLDDGFSLEMIDNFLAKIKEISDFETGDKEFETQYSKYLQTDAEAAARHQELKTFLGSTKF